MDLSFKDKINKILQMDCLEYLKELPDKCIDLVLIDPPYNIKVADWDNWKNPQDYINWLGNVFLECERVLKDNGSFYFWHNDFLQIVELQNYINKNTKFVFNSIISWVKPNFRNFAWRNRTENSNLRTWFNIQEYCLYYTFQDSGTGLKDIYSRKDCFVSVREYMRQEKVKLKNFKNFKNDAEFNIFVNNITNTSSVVSRHYFADNQWVFPTEAIYKKLQTSGFFQKPYEELRAEYEELRAKFNIKNGENINNVWYSKVKQNTSKYHICEKPQDLLMKIINTSSNENDVVLDCFMGSGSTALACIETNRNFLGCEISEKYCEIANERIKIRKNVIL